MISVTIRNSWNKETVLEVFKTLHCHQFSGRWIVLPLENDFLELSKRVQTQSLVKFSIFCLKITFYLL